MQETEHFRLISGPFLCGTEATAPRLNCQHLLLEEVTRFGYGTIFQASEVSPPRLPRFAEWSAAYKSLRG